MATATNGTPMLDELEKGPWPSFVTEIKKAAKKSPMANDELGQLEYSFKTKRGSDLPEQFPEVAHFHTVRLNQPSGFFYTADALRMICDIWDKYGSGITNMHGSTGDIVLLGTKTEHLEAIFAAHTG